MSSASDLVLYSGTVITASWQERLDAAVAGGFGSISLFPHDYLAAQAGGLTDADMRDQLATAHLRVAVVDPVTTWLPGSTPPAGTGPDLLAFAGHSHQEIFDIAVAVGAPTVNALEFWGVRVDVDDAGRAFGRLCDAAAERDLRVHLEAMPFSGIPDLATALAIVERADRPNGGLLLDSWHWFRGRNTMDQLRGVPGERILAVQLSDGPEVPAADLSAESMQARLLPGDGDWPLAGWLDAIASTGARPTFGAEVFSTQLAGQAPVDTGRSCGQATRELLQAAGLTGREH